MADHRRHGLLDPRSPAAARFTDLRLSLEVGAPADQARVLFTSVARGTGTSFVAANYALASAAAGRTVLLVDADVRRPSLHELFGSLHAPAASSAEPGGRMHLWQVAPGIDLLTGHRNAQLSGDLAGIEPVMRLLDTGAPDYDVVIVDAPPVPEGRETAVLAAVEGMRSVVVVSPGTRRRALVQICRRLDAIGGTVAGLVMNRDRRTVGGVAA